MALALALALRPWRLLAGGRLLTPLLASLVVLPWLWALPSLHAMPLQLQWSGACLVLLMLGWPLAIPVLCLVAVIATVIAGAGWTETVAMAAWVGVLPATIGLAIGAAVRRVLGTHPFVYVLGRAFAGSVLSLFAASVLRQSSGEALPGVGPNLSLVAHWLTAWGDAFVTGMLAAIFVAFRPQWLATWSDALSLRR
ncbi:MAG TPA: hypothetical protein VGE20_01285 [Ramlibacter sp.]